MPRVREGLGLRPSVAMRRRFVRAVRARRGACAHAEAPYTRAGFALWVREESGLRPSVAVCRWFVGAVPARCGACAHADSCATRPVRIPRGVHAAGTGEAGMKACDQRNCA